MAGTSLRECEQGVRVRESWIQRNCSFKFLGRLLHIGSVHKRPAPAHQQRRIIMNARIPGISLRGSLEIFGRTGEIARLQVCVPETTASGGIVGVRFQYFLKFGGGLLVVVGRMQVYVSD